MLTLVVLGDADSRTVKLAKPQSDLTTASDGSDNEGVILSSRVRTAPAVEWEGGKSGTEPSSNNTVELAAKTVPFNYHV